MDEDKRRAAEENIGTAPKQDAVPSNMKLTYETYLGDLLGSHIANDARNQRQHDAAYAAADNIADPTLDHLTGIGAHQLTEDTAAHRAGNRIPDSSK